MVRAIKCKNLILTALILAILLACSILVADNASAATIGVVHDTGSDGLFVRSGPGSTYSVIHAIYDGNEVAIIEKSGDWYKITHNGITGYSHSDYIKVKEISDDQNDYVYSEDFEEALENEGFPESYKYYLRQIHANHPNWVFRAHRTNINWDDAVKKESAVSINLVHRSADESWKSREYGALDSNGNHIEFDSGGWIAASSGIIQYYMDPRNFLNDSDVFQFMSHSYDALTQKKEGLQKLVAGTFLANKFPEAGYDTYSDILIYAGKNANANPYVLASMILVEQGKQGTGNSISGKVSGFEGYYNFFNVRAYAADGYDAVEYGLLYAKGSGEYNRPWDTRAKSIIGGALHYATGFINNKQNTLYLKKFNVMNGLNQVATHQYMTNVAGAAQEAGNLKNGYGANDAVTFYIPVYNNMPTVACNKPSGGNNDYFLKMLEVAGYDLLPAFNMYKDTYEVIVPSDASVVDINAVPNNSASKVTGAGKVSLTGNVTDVKITVTASSGEKKTYTITVAKQTSNSEDITSSTYKVGSKITGVGFETPISTFKSKINVPNGYSVKIVYQDGTEITSGNVGTGTKVVMYKGNSAVKNYAVVIKGDANGDSKVTSVDSLMIKRHIIGTYNLSGDYKDGADVNGDGKITSVDSLMIKRHIIGTYTINN